MQTVRVHGREASFGRAGEGPAVVLVHGIAGDASEWAPVCERLAGGFDVIAPDLAGHGSSARLRGDHSIGAFACWLRDLLETIGVERATFVGHSLGGGVVMQFAYQFPQYVERMVLVSSGGLGREVSPLIRAAALPGAEHVLGVLGGAANAVQPALAVAGVRPSSEGGELVRRIAGMTDRDRRAAFVRAVRAVASPGGQRVSAGDRLYLAADVPTLIVWGARDRIIPVHHAHATAAALPGSRLEIFENSGHFPHGVEPSRFTSLVERFVEETPSAAYDRLRTRERMLDRQEPYVGGANPAVARGSRLR
jgi:pimeloyl-ACP methyl ester carboxylesterase